jgi:hypothetical protein
MPARRADPAAVQAAVHPVLAWLEGDADPPPRPVLAAAVRVSLRTFADLHPGRAVEVRVPPFAAIQCLPGHTHTRGTPPYVVETDARGWLSLVTGKLTWSEALAADVVKASGHRTAEIGPLLPMHY